MFIVRLFLAIAAVVGSQQCLFSSLLGSEATGFTDGNSSLARMNGPRGLAPDYNASVLYIADEFNKRIRLAYPNLTVSTLAGTGVSGYLDGPCNEARFSSPTGLGLDNSTGTLYIADYNGHRIRGINVSFSPCIVFTVAGSGVAGVSSGPYASAQFSSPYSMVAWRGDVWVSDSYPGIRWLNSSGRNVVNLMSGVSGFVDGPCPQARTTFTRGVSIALDAAGRPEILYFIDMPGNRVRAMLLSPCTVSTLAGSPLGLAGWADGVSTVALFHNPWAAWLDPSSQSLIVADSNNNRLRRVLLQNGTVSTIAGTGIFLWSTQGYFGIPGGQSIGYPRGVSPVPPAFGSNLWAVSEGAAGSVRLFTCNLSTVPLNLAAAYAPPTPWPSLGGYPSLGTPSSTQITSRTPTPSPSLSPSINPSASPAPCTVTTLAGLSGVPGTMDGALGVSRIANATSMVFNASGDGGGTTSGALFIAEGRGHTIRRFSIATGILSLVAGAPGVPGFINGAAAGVARFNAPGGLAVAGGGSLYISDSGNHALRSLDIATGLVNTLAGGGSVGYCDGAAPFACFNNPTALAFQSSSATLFIADTGNHRIRTLRGGWVSFLAGAGSLGPGANDGTGAFAQFVSPRALLLSGAWLVVADGTRRLRKVHTVSGMSVAFSGGGAWAAGNGAAVNGPASSAAFWNATGLASLWGGAPSSSSLNPTVLVADSSALRWVGAGGTAASLAGSLGPIPSSNGSLDGVGGLATFNGAAAVAVDPASLAIYVAENSGCVLRLVSCSPALLSMPPGGASSWVATAPGASTSPTPTPDPRPNTCMVGALAGTGSSGSAGSGWSDGIGTGAKFFRPSAAALPSGPLAAGLPLGTFLTSGLSEFCFRFLAPNGTVWRYTGICGTAGTANGVNPTFSGSTGFVGDTSGGLWVADTYNHLIRRIAFQPPSGVTSTVCGTTSSGFADGLGTSASFNQPYGIALHSSGLFVSDQFNHRLRFVSIPGFLVSTLAGSGTVGGFADGPGSLSALNGPRSIVTSSDGALLYIADFGNQRIRVYTVATGMMSTLVGSGISGLSTGGVGAILSTPQALALHPSLGLLIGEGGTSSMLLAFEFSSGLLTPLVGQTWYHTFPRIGPGAEAGFHSIGALLLGADNSTVFIGDQNSHAWRSLTGCGGGGVGGGV